MKNVTLIILATLLSTSIFAQNVKLPEPQKTGGKPLMEAIAQRQSARDFDTQKELSMQQLSNILWAAYGYNRPNMRTVPSANNKQAFEVYVTLKGGMYLYNAATNTLELKSSKDLRGATGKQPFVATAPVNLVYVYSTELQSNEYMAYADCGFISQNVYLACASEGLATVVRGNMDVATMQKEFNLPKTKKPVLSQTIGYAKAKK